MPVISGGSGGGGATFNGGTITEGLTIADPDGAEDQLTITGTGSGTAKLLNATAVHQVFSVTSDGVAVMSSDDAMDFTVAGTAGTDGVMRVSGGTPSTTILLNTSQGVSLTDGSGLAYLLYRGGFIIGLTAAPADGDLSAGQMALWFDQTNGASKLMIKAKQADGTVKTGSVSLA